MREGATAAESLAFLDQGSRAAVEKYRNGQPSVITRSECISFTLTTAYAEFANEEPHVTHGLTEAEFDDLWTNHVLPMRFK